MSDDSFKLHQETFTNELDLRNGHFAGDSFKLHLIDNYE